MNGQHDWDKKFKALTKGLFNVRFLAYPTVQKVLKSDKKHYDLSRLDLLLGTTLIAPSRSACQSPDLRDGNPLPLTRLASRHSNDLSIH